MFKVFVFDQNIFGESEDVPNATNANARIINIFYIINIYIDVIRNKKKCACPANNF